MESPKGVLAQQNDIHHNTRTRESQTGEFSTKLCTSDNQMVVDLSTPNKPPQRRNA